MAQRLPQTRDPMALVSPGFRYLHEPMRAQDAVPFLGDPGLVEHLKERIRYSAGGTFLISGFRGVGKTTLVLRALDELAGERGGPILLPVVLSVARSTSTDRLLVAIIRRIFETLNDQGYLARLPSRTQQALLLSYARTSLQLKQTTTEASERAANLDLGLADKAVKTVTAGLFTSKAGMSAKRSRALASEAAYLNYSETDAEYDLIRIIHLLTNAPDTAPAGRRRRWRRRRPGAPRIHIVVVIDEVDKLTAEDAGLEGVRRTLSEMKNVLTMPGAHFLVVAGPDLHDRVVMDVGRGNSVYESVFAWRLYVPCSWSAADDLTGALLRWRNDLPASVTEGLVDYLEFKGRGIPRRLLQEFNGFVRWEGGRPGLFLTEEDQQRIRFYAELEGTLQAFFEQRDAASFSLALDEDRWRLGCYYIVDWILRSNGRPFTVADLENAVQNLELDPSLHISQNLADPLLGHLAARDVIEVIRDPGADSTMIGDVAEAQQKSYRLATRIRERLIGFARGNEAERADLNVSGALEPQARDDGPPIMTLGAGRYSLTSVIGQGGTSTVYRGRDSRLNIDVAVKVLHPTLANDPRTRARFRREMAIAKEVVHRHIVRTLDIMDDELALIMELVQGRSLSEILDTDGPCPPGQAARIGLALSDALAHLSARGLARVDIKPANILMAADRGPVIIDLGIIKRWTGNTMDITAPQVVVGTPLYLAPEQLSGEPADIRSDIYALGLLMLVLILGRHPHADLPMEAIFYRVVQQGIDTSELEITPPFRRVLDTALMPDREARYQTPQQLHEALLDTPEGLAASGMP
ncbi:Serine/threonine protein kinase [Thermomonospora echinospora]|uniref:non-specific serine/threonine protein kinase n=1 Tax=Thermomonospora echinospora TaxID=1992 RepID=A0A1H5TWD6_9ACTN|nr:protein kinase [Thermomonospora echinospora]SEF67155.1 Serine/threonine protein kinase [Thermomonospora echinospora]